MRYHFTQIPNLILSIFITKLFFRPARLIRLPVDIRNYRYITFGENLTTGRNNRIECYKFGKNIPKLAHQMHHPNQHLKTVCH